MNHISLIRFTECCMFLTSLNEISAHLIKSLGICRGPHNFLLAIPFLKNFVDQIIKLFQRITLLRPNEEKTATNNKMFCL